MVVEGMQFLAFPQGRRQDMADKKMSKRPGKTIKPGASGKELDEKALDKVTGGLGEIVITKTTDSSSPKL
jgi:bacteriocin-like protein